MPANIELKISANGETDMSASKGNQKFEQHLKAPRFEDGPALQIAGLRRDYNPEEMNKIPEQWNDFMPYIGKVPGQIGRIAYGLCYLNQGSSRMSYVSGVGVSNCERIPAELTCAKIPAQKYAIFVHPGHVSTLWQTCDAIQNRWLPGSGHELVPVTSDSPNFFERYGEDFDPKTGMGGIEVWVPIKS
jgi:AraC family transcriptional regulator